MKIVFRGYFVRIVKIHENSLKGEIEMKKFSVLVLLGLILTGCTTTQKGTTIGGLTGAALGGIIGHQSGNDAAGIAIGGAVGGLGGYAVGEKMKSKFCPVGGEQYDGSVKFCPTHGVELKEVEK